MSIKVCFLGSARYTRPLDQTAEKKFRAISSLGEVFVVGFSSDLQPLRFTEHAHFYLLPKLPLPILRYVELLVVGQLLILWLIFRHRIQVVIAQSPYEGFVAALAIKFAAWFGYKVGLAVEVHGDFEESLFLYRRIRFRALHRFVMKQAALYSLAQADVLRAISNSTIEQVRRWAPQKTIISFPTWTDIDTFLRSGAHRGNDCANAILFVGMVTPLKGIHYLINAFSFIADEFRESRLIIIGKEENVGYADQLRQQIKKLGLQNRVQCIGYQSQAELAVWMATASVLVLPSKSEGLPRVIIEAMATGTPVIGSRVGGIPELIKDGVNGFLIAPGDEKSLAEKIRLLLENRVAARAMGASGRSFAAQLFSTENYLKGYRQIFEMTTPTLPRESMRLLLFNLATDADDPILGFTTLWIGALAARVDFIHVITMRMGKLDLPDNVRVYSVGKERGYNEARRVFEFYRILGRILRDHGIDVCFSHMIPMFTVLAAPVLKIKGIPIITWYAHPKVTRTLKLAHRLSDQMVSCLSSAYPYKHDKLLQVGHGIDTSLFFPDAAIIREDLPVILCVGRLSPVKDHPTLIKAVGLLRQTWAEPFRVVILGAAATAGDDGYVRSLHQQIKELSLEEIVSFEAPVPVTQLPAWYRRASVYVNMTQTGSADKVAWEAMGCGVLCIAANEGFKDTLGIYADRCVYDYGNAVSLMDRLKWALSLPQSERAAIGAYLGKRMETMHGLDRLSQSLVTIFQAAASRNDPRLDSETNPDRLRPNDA